MLYFNYKCSKLTNLGKHTTLSPQYVDKVIDVITAIVLSLGRRNNQLRLHVRNVLTTSPKLPSTPTLLFLLGLVADPEADNASQSKKLVRSI